jgi:hypothetical protein
MTSVVPPKLHISLTWALAPAQFRTPQMHFSASSLVVPINALNWPWLQPPRDVFSLNRRSHADSCGPIKTSRLTATKIDTPKHGRFPMRTQINEGLGLHATIEAWSCRAIKPNQLPEPNLRLVCSSRKFKRSDELRSSCNLQPDCWWRYS